MKAFASVLGLLAASVLVLGFTAPVDQAQAGAMIVVPSTPDQCPAAPDDEAVGKSTCYNCGSASKGQCAGANQCTGSRDECQKKGCYITGTSSCSTAANSKKC